MLHNAVVLPDISNQQIEEMLQIMQPVMLGPAGLELIDIQGVDRRNVSYIWDPKILRPVRLAYGNGWDAELLTFHKFGASSLFKPSLAETLACIRQWMPTRWHEVKFFWLDSRNLSSTNIVGEFHYCRCKLFTKEFPA